MHFTISRPFCFLLVALALLAESASPTGAQTRTINVRGKKMEFVPEPALMVVRPKGEAKADDLTKAAIDVQARLLEQPTGPLILQLAKNPPKVLPRGNGVVLPRFAGLRADHLNRLPEMSGLIAEAGVVYRCGKQLAIPTGAVLVRFEEEPAASRVRGLETAFRLEEVDRVKGAPHTVRFRPSRAGADLFELSEAIAARPEVAWAEPAFVGEVIRDDLETRFPNDRFASSQWHLSDGPEGINLPQAWAHWTGGEEGIIVAVIDDGVDLKHKDLAGKLLPGYDFLDDDDDPTPSPKDSHGTCCAGLIGAATHNDLGVAGACWSAKILPIRIFSSESGFAPTEVIAESFYFAQENGAKVLSCSWGYNIPVNVIYDAIDQVHQEGCLVLASAGNSGEDDWYHFVHFPAAYQNVMAIGAVRPENIRWTFSCHGPEVALSAPSSDGREHGIWTTDHSGPHGYNPGGEDSTEASGDYFSHFGGTSAACPIAAGVAALVWSAHPELTNVQVWEILEGTAAKIDPEGGKWREGRSPYYGAGKVDALAALVKAGEVSRNLGDRATGRPPFPRNFSIPGVRPERSSPPGDSD